MVSINEELAQLPTRRDNVANMKGMLLFLPRTQLIVVPIRQHPDGGYDCVIVKGNSTYHRNDYDIFVSAREMLRALELDVSSHLDFKTLE